MGTKSTPLNPSFSGNIIIDENNDRLVVSENNIPIGIFGKDQNGNVVVKIAPVGVNVLGATDEQLIFNSNQNILKVVMKGTITVPSFTIATSGSGIYSSTVSHNLGVIPFAQVILNGESQIEVVDGWSSGITTTTPYSVSTTIEQATNLFVAPPLNSGANPTITNNWSLDTNNLYISLQIVNNSSSSTITVESFTLDYVIFMPIQ